ncbi:hypothetical protein SAMN05443246_5065 [Paenibacillus sp. GP183]|nr:hypothetical protein SAMN05443246_5065 [Paenibacillus sp. GP183]
MIKGGHFMEYIIQLKWIFMDELAGQPLLFLL